MTSCSSASLPSACRHENHGRRRVALSAKCQTTRFGSVGCQQARAAREDASFYCVPPRLKVDSKRMPLHNGDNLKQEWLYSKWTLKDQDTVGIALELAGSLSTARAGFGVALSI